MLGSNKIESIVGGRERNRKGKTGSLKKGGEIEANTPPYCILY